MEMGTGKVEKILKGRLDYIPSPSPSVKIQIMGGKVCLTFKGSTLLGVVNKLSTFEFQSNFSLDRNQRCLYIDSQRIFCVFLIKMFHRQFQEKKSSLPKLLHKI